MQVAEVDRIFTHNEAEVQRETEAHQETVMCAPAVEDAHSSLGLKRKPVLEEPLPMPFPLPKNYSPLVAAGLQAKSLNWWQLVYRPRA